MTLLDRPAPPAPPAPPALLKDLLCTSDLTPGDLYHVLALAADVKPHQVNPALMRLAAPHAVFLHCLPAHRGDEVTAEVMGSDQSLVFPQADNRLPTATAALVALTRRSLQGANR